MCTVNTGDICEIDANCGSTICNSGISNIYIWDETILTWRHYVNNPMAGIKFKRITATTSGSNDTIWGLDYSDQPAMGGLWKLINPSTGHWIQTANGTTRSVMADVMNNTQTTTVQTIFSIATDRINVYALIQTTVDIMDMSNINNDMTTTQWGVFTVGLNSSNQAVFTAVINTTPPRVGGTDIVNIIDFDVNTGRDILVVGNTNISNTTTNTVYSLALGDNSFTEVPIDNRPSSFKQARFYYVIGTISMITINNAQNVAYVSGNNPGNELIQFAGVIAMATSPISFPEGGNNNYTITDYNFSDINVGDITASATTADLNINQLWLIAPNPSSQNTGYYQIVGGPQFSIPGYVGNQSRLLVTNNQIYTQSNGVCN
jgi:hypothetical protein